MENIYIGADFDILTLEGSGGFEFDPENPPVVILHNKPQKTYYTADVLDISTVTNTCDVKWSYEVTSKMIPGVYSLDVYDDTKRVLLHHKDDYAKAYTVSASPGQHSGESES